MFCTRCGSSLPEGAAFCPTCGAPAVAGAPAPGIPPPPPPAPPGAAPSAVAAPPASTAAAPAPVFGGFWRRLWAYVLDRFLLGILFVPALFFLLLPILAGAGLSLSDGEFPAGLVPGMVGALLAAGAIAIVGTWLYYALMQSSGKQATLGQMALGLRVTDLRGGRLSFARATGRYFAHILTGLTLGLGYLVMLFTERRQTLHDLAAGTLVVRSGP